MVISKSGIYYVYGCYVEDELKYVGMGKGKRLNHCMSGKSSCSELNRDFHAGLRMRVEKLFNNITEQDAREKEADLINKNFATLYNRAKNQRNKSFPNLRLSKTFKILANNWSTGDDEALFERHLNEYMGIDLNSELYSRLMDTLTQDGKGLYLLESESKTRLLVIDRVDEVQMDKWFDNTFAHMAHPEGLYGGGYGMKMALDKSIRED